MHGTSPWALQGPLAARVPLSQGSPGDVLQPQPFANFLTAGQKPLADKVPLSPDAAGVVLQPEPFALQEILEAGQEPLADRVSQAPDSADVALQPELFALQDSCAADQEPVAESLPFPPDSAGIALEPEPFVLQDVFESGQESGLDKLLNNDGFESALQLSCLQTAKPLRCSARVEKSATSSSRSKPGRAKVPDNIRRSLRCGL
jgi:hypothetical protein